MAITNALAGIAVSNLSSAIAWYRNLLGRGPDQQPMPEVAEWAFDKGGWIQVFEDFERSGHSSITLAESDLAARLADLRAKGIEVGDATSSNIVKTAIVTDPDGNRIVFAEAQSKENRSVS